MISLQLDPRQLEQTALELDATEREVKLAMRSTVSKMAGWLRTRAGRVIRKETLLKHEQIRRRLKSIRVKVRANGVTGGVWIGLNEIDLAGLTPEQDGFGVSAGPPGRSRSYENAFMGPRPGVLASKLNGGVFRRTTAKRLPLERLGMPIKSDAEKALDSDVFKGFEDQFYKVFEHELKWRMQSQK